MPNYDFTCIRTIAFTCPCTAQGETDTQTLWEAFCARARTVPFEEIQEASGVFADDLTDENGLPPSDAERVSPPCRCDDCGAITAELHLNPVKHLILRVDEGGPEPAGECPECGALSYRLPENPQEW